MTAARLAYAPLERLLARRQPTHLPPTTDDQAADLGVTDRTIFRYRRHGLTIRQADHAAIAIGMHPAAIWGTDFYADLDPKNLHVIGVAHSHDMTGQSRQGAAA